MTNQEALDLWQDGFDEAMDRMAYWLDKAWGCEPDSILRLRGLIETGPVPEAGRGGVS